MKRDSQSGQVPFTYSREEVGNLTFLDSANACSSVEGRKMQRTISEDQKKEKSKEGQ